VQWSPQHTRRDLLEHLQSDEQVSDCKLLAAVDTTKIWNCFANRMSNYSGVSLFVRILGYSVFANVHQLLILSPGSPLRDPFAAHKKID
jgi:hypothetical protein